MTAYLKAWLLKHLPLSLIILPLLHVGGIPVFKGGYETPVFDTASGKLEPGQYAQDPRTLDYVAMIAEKTEAGTTTQEDVIIPAHLTSSKTPFSSMELVHEVGIESFAIFDVDGQKMEQPVTAKEYQDSEVNIKPIYSTADAKPK